MLLLLDSRRFTAKLEKKVFQKLITLTKSCASESSLRCVIPDGVFVGFSFDDDPVSVCQPCAQTQCEGNILQTGSRHTDG